jgi:tripartite-type tricarboxylate transporter receptor subunit TctC
MWLHKTVSIGLVAMLGAAAVTSGAAAEDDFYKDKQVRLIVPTPTGGSYDAFARILAAHMPKFIPGRPTIITLNMPGAGGIKSANFVYNTAPRDGLTIGAGYSGLPTTNLLAPEGALFDATKFSWIGSLTREPYVAIVWHTSPIQKLEDLKTREMIVGGSAVGAAGTDFPIIAREMFGFKLKIVTGYPNSPDMKLAMQRGELDGVFATAWGAIQITEPTWVPEGKVRVIVQHGLKPHRDLPNVPLFIDQARTPEERQILELLFARQETAKPYFAPPEIPSERLQILRRAFDATVKDAAFLAEVKKSRLEVNEPMTGEEAEAFTRKLAETPPAIVKRIVDELNRFKDNK